MTLCFFSIIMYDIIISLNSIKPSSQLYLNDFRVPNYKGLYIKKFEHALEDQIYRILRKSRVITNYRYIKTDCFDLFTYILKPSPGWALAFKTMPLHTVLSMVCRFIPAFPGHRCFVLVFVARMCLCGRVASRIHNHLLFLGLGPAREEELTPRQS